MSIIQKTTLEGRTPEIEKFAAQAARNNQYVVTENIVETTPGKVKKEVQQPVGFFSQKCFETILRELEKNSKLYYNDCGVDVNAIEIISTNITKALTVAWAAMVAERVKTIRQFSYVKAKPNLKSNVEEVKEVKKNENPIKPEIFKPITKLFN